jgi:hypothetical protein
MFHYAFSIAIILNVIGAKEVLGKRLVDVWVTLSAVIFQFRQGVSCSDCRDWECDGLNFTGNGFGYSMQSTKCDCGCCGLGYFDNSRSGSIENVVTEESVEGGTIMVRGAIPVAIRVSAISTSPPPLPPSVSALGIDVSGGSRLLGFVVEPGPHPMSVQRGLHSCCNTQI